MDDFLSSRVCHEEYKEKLNTASEQKCCSRSSRGSRQVSARHPATSYNLDPKALNP